MKLGIMQPYFFPYIGYFSLIAHTDQWIVFDITQYTPKSWMNRNRVLHPDHGWNYISAPLKHSSISLAIHEAKVQDVAATGKSLLGKLTHYRKQAPYYQAVIKLLTETFSGMTSDSLVSVNVTAMAAVCNYLNIPFRYKVCSELQLNLPRELPPGEWAPRICQLLEADAYLNPIGGNHLFNPDDFSKVGVDLEFLKTPEFTYPTAGYAFEPSLSILDVMMWNSPDAIKDIIQNRCELLRMDV